jgi:hypothetical protein
MMGRLLGQGVGMMKPVVFGTVTAINGNSLTVSGRQGLGAPSTATVTYTVDASKASVRKNNATSTVSAIAVGDTVAISGSVSGTTVIAKVIRDGAPGMMGQGQGFGRFASSTAGIIGNGQPVVAGKVSTITGNSLTITNISNVTYTVDVSSAKILAGPNPITISNIAVGDTVIVQGTVNGTAISASTLIDQTQIASSTQAKKQAGPRGLFAGVGQFFKHLFGF